MIEQLAKIISDYKGEAVVLTLDTVIISDLGLNSLDLVNLVTEIEDEFDVEIDEREAVKIHTVGEAVDYIESISE